MRLLVVGAGSTGGYFGARLMQAGRDVTFLVRPKRAAELVANGLSIVSPHGNVTLKPKLISADALTESYEAVLLTVKGYQLEAALADIAPAVGAETMILPVLNGMQHMDVLASRFTPRNVAGCALKVATILEDDGRIVQLAPMQDLVYGELDGSETPRMRKLDAFMQGAGFDARLSTAVHREMWEKWILLAAVGAMTCLMRGPIGEIEACPGSTDFTLALLDEVVAIVRAVGVPPSEAFVTAARQQVTAKGSPFASSMYRDVLRGRPVEVENILGDLLQRGIGAGVATPLLSAATLYLRVYQNKMRPPADAFPAL